MVNPSVYLIDDNLPTNVYNEIIISESGLFSNWDIFNSAELALDSLEKSAWLPNIILLDINMPKMNGWEFLEVLEERYGTSLGITVIMLTTSMSRFDKEKASGYSFVQGILEKPLDESKLHEVLGLLVNNT